MKIVRARAPLRLGLAGGGTDVAPYCCTYGGKVINVTIDRYAYATIKEMSGKTVRFDAADQGLIEVFDPRDDGGDIQGPLKLQHGVYRRIMAQFNDGKPLPLELSTYSEAAAGSGLGSSSTLVVAMLEAFKEYLQLPLGEYDIAHLAYEIERKDLGLKGGKQDQYAATFGGLNLIEFYNDDRVIVNPLRLKETIAAELEASLVLYFTGISRESANIIEQQSRVMERGDGKSLEAMHQIKAEVDELKVSLLKANFEKMAETLERGWIAKKQSAECISNPFIEEVYEKAKAAGALAGKVSGAGGGGFMMFITDPLRRPYVIRALEQGEQGKVMTCKLVEKGAMSWRV